MQHGYGNACGIEMGGTDKTGTVPNKSNATKFEALVCTTMVAVSMTDDSID